MSWIRWSRFDVTDSADERAHLRFRPMNFTTSVEVTFFFPVSEKKVTKESPVCWAGLFALVLNREKAGPELHSLNAFTPSALGEKRSRTARRVKIVEGLGKNGYQVRVNYSRTRTLMLPASIGTRLKFGSLSHVPGKSPVTKSPSFPSPPSITLNTS